MPATGTIVAVSSNRLLDGDTFGLGDGERSCIFEFDRDGLVIPGRCRIDIDCFLCTLTADQVAFRIDSAIAVAAGAAGPQILAAAMGSQVLLNNARAGLSGNQGIIDGVVDPGFTVQGMSGGSGFDCPSGTGCVSNSDCEWALTCQDAGTGKTCQ